MKQAILPRYDVNEFLEGFGSFYFIGHRRVGDNQLLREVALLAMTQKPRVFFDTSFPSPSLLLLAVYTKMRVFFLVRPVLS